MSGLQIIFLIIGAVTLVCAVLVVTARRIMHAALWLIAALFGVAAMFATLETGFFTAIQVAVYIGAIAILIIFTVMLTRRSMEDVGPQVNKNWPIGLAVSALALVGLVYLLAQFPGSQVGERAPMTGGEDIAALGKALVSPDGYLVPFEIASILLIAALIGAIFIAGEPKK
jgi:NADH-quinone oxidoreductase subunit J